MIIRKSKLSLENMTPLDREVEIKRRKAQEEEKIATFGQDSEDKAIPWVQKEIDNQDKKKQEYFLLMTSLLKSKLSKKKIYNKFLAEIFLHFARYENIPKKYAINLETNETGLLMELRGTKYYGAFVTCGIPSYDFRAAQALAIRLGNTVAKLEGHFRKSQGGVVLPDGEDLKVYG